MINTIKYKGGQFKFLTELFGMILLYGQKQFNVICKLLAKSQLMGVWEHEIIIAGRESWAMGLKDVLPQELSTPASYGMLTQHAQSRTLHIF